MTQKTVTIIGQGYVGLPLAQEIVRSGWKVYGLDNSTRVVKGLAEGRSHVDDLADEEIKEMLAAGYQPTDDATVIRDSAVVVICVPTPLDEDGLPKLDYVKSAATTVGQNLRDGQVVILESTTYPGTTETLVVPAIEKSSGKTAGKDFFVAFSPERVDPGRTDYGIANTPKLVGGVGEADTHAAVQFYSSFIQEVVTMKGAKEAETAKLLENTFRHVNIALVNEMAKFCHELDIDIWDVINGASTKPFGFMKFTPGPGVGGHCIPIDPNYLSHEVRRQLGYPFRFVELAQEINSSMPTYVVGRIQDILNLEGKALRGAQVLLLGVTYKPNIADQRESPAVPIAEALADKGAIVQFHDPFVENWTAVSNPLSRVSDFEQAVSTADIVVLLQKHASYDIEVIARNSKSLLDTQGIAPEKQQRL